MRKSFSLKEVKNINRLVRRDKDKCVAINPPQKIEFLPNLDNS